MEASVMAYTNKRDQNLKNVATVITELLKSCPIYPYFFVNTRHKDLFLQIFNVSPYKMRGLDSLSRVLQTC